MAAAERATSIAPAPPRGAASGGAGYTVTLLSGDRVTVRSADAGTGSVRPGTGREQMSFAMFTVDGHLFVLPADARRLVQTGKLDRRLFDVTGLIAAGYHDAARQTVPLILQDRRGGAARGTVAPGLRGVLAGTGATVRRDLPAIDGAAVTAPKAHLGALWETLTANRTTAQADPAAGVAKIWLDGQRRPLLDHSVPQIGAPAAWRAGFTGRGVIVGVLDTGIDATHPDLAGKIAASVNYSNDKPGDQVGHGTHVASTIAGSGAASGGKYRGVAPDATLVNAKVCTEDDCSDSSIIAGMQWAAQEQHARVVNMSLGGTDFPGPDPMEVAVDTLTAQTGTLFVVAAGNDGRRGAGTISSPASAAAALTVGAVDRNDALADFSSRGPRSYDYGLKPDITAPGVNIVAARGAGTELGVPVGDSYVTASGTSMATPHVVGAVALLAQQHPDWKADRLKATLMASAKTDPTRGAFDQGAGRVDVARAITQTLTADPPSVSFPMASWPHTDDTPTTRTFSYHNASAADVRLTLSVRALGATGRPAPSGMFTLDTNEVAVPAGGTAKVALTADTRVTSPDMAYSGEVVATDGQQSIVTPFGVNKEVESYNLVLRHLDATRAPATDYQTALRGLDGGPGFLMYDPSGTITVRRPKGRFAVCTVIASPSKGDRPAEALIAAPLINLRADTTIVLDARKAKPVSMTVPERSAKLFGVGVDVKHLAEPFTDTCGILRPDFAGLSTAQVGARLPARQFVTTISSVWAKPDAAGRPALDSPYDYRVAEPFPGRFPTGLKKRYAKRELAAVRQDYRATDTGQAGVQEVHAVAGVRAPGIDHRLPFAVPSTRVEYYSTRVPWAVNATVIGRPNADGELENSVWYFQDATTYRPARRYAQVWGSGPFGPALPPSQDLANFAARTGDFLYLSVPLLGDGAGHGGQAPADLKLFRNGTLIGTSEWPAFFDQVPPEEAGYRLEMTGSSTALGGLSSTVNLAMTFRSQHTAETAWAKVSLPGVVRYTPRLDVGNAAPAGKAFTIPVTVQRQRGNEGNTVRKLTIDVSYDDGVTWRPSTLTRRGATSWTATVVHPARSGFVSLRANSIDSAGNTLAQTIIHAYRLTSR